MGDRAVYWRKRVEAWSRSGLSQAEYCRRQGLQPVSFSWWKRRLSTAAQAPGRGRPRPRGRVAVPAGFIEVRLPDVAGPAVYEIRLAGDRSIRVPGDFEAATLTRLIAAVEAAGTPRRGVAAPC